MTYCFVDQHEARVYYAGFQTVDRIAVEWDTFLLDAGYCLDAPSLLSPGAMTRGNYGPYIQYIAR